MNLHFFRHAQALPTNPGQHDLERILSELGRQQAMQRRRHNGPFFGPVLHSPATRAKQTAEILAVLDIPDSHRDLIVVPELFTSQDEHSKAIDALFPQLKYAPLRTYHTHDQSHAVETFAQHGAKALAENISTWEQQRDEKTDNALVVGHAILINAIAIAHCSHLTPESIQALLDLQLGEAEGFTVLDDGLLILHQN